MVGRDERYSLSRGAFGAAALIDALIAGKGGSWALAVTGDAGHVGQARFTLSDGTASVVAYSGAAVSNNNAWRHVVVSVRRGTAVNVYVDGSGGTTVTDTTSGALGSAASLLIGAGPSGPAFKGSVDEVAVYRSALSGGRVTVRWRLGAQLDHGAPVVTLSSPADGSSSVDATPAFSGAAGNASTDASTVVVSITPDASAGPLETFESDEFGVPADPGYPHRYGWLGGKERSTELSSGVIQMGVRSYVPAIGRFLQPDPVVGGSANPYDYSNQDPVNQLDPDGDAPVHGKKIRICLATIGCIWVTAGDASGGKIPSPPRAPKPAPGDVEPVRAPDNGGEGGSSDGDGEKKEHRHHHKRRHHHRKKDPCEQNYCA